MGRNIDTSFFTENNKIDHTSIRQKSLWDTEEMTHALEILQSRVDVLETSINSFSPVLEIREIKMTIRHIEDCLVEMHKRQVKEEEVEG